MNRPIALIAAVTSVALCCAGCASTQKKGAGAAGGTGGAASAPGAGSVPDEAKPYASDLRDLASPCPASDVAIRTLPGKPSWFHVKGCTFDEKAYCNPAFRCKKKSGASACIPSTLMKKVYLKRPSRYCKEPG